VNSDFTQIPSGKADECNGDLSILEWARLEAIRINRTYDWFASNRSATIGFNT
jgi:hypothetical protein